MPGSRCVGPNSSSTSVRGKMTVSPGFKLSSACEVVHNKHRRIPKANSLPNATGFCKRMPRQESQCHIWFTAPGSESDRNQDKKLDTPRCFLDRSRLPYNDEVMSQGMRPYLRPEVGTQRGTNLTSRSLALRLKGGYQLISWTSLFWFTSLPNISKHAFGTSRWVNPDGRHLRTWRFRQLDAHHDRGIGDVAM